MIGSFRSWSASRAKERTRAQEAEARAQREQLRDFIRIEVVQALGVAAILTIAFVLGLRVFAMLPTKALMEDETS